MGDIHMNIKSNKVLALSLITLLSVAPALQSMSYVNGAWNGIKVAPAKTWSVAKATPGYAWNGIKVGFSKAFDGAKAASGYAWNGVKAAPAKTWAVVKATPACAWNATKSTGRHVWRNKKKYAAATTGTVLAALAYMNPTVVKEYAKNACDASTGLWNRVLRK